MSNTPSEPTGNDKPGPNTRGPELGVAGFLLLVAVLVIADSLRVGIGWADDGPRSGYFPFYIGLFLLAASATIFISTLINWRAINTVFAEREQLATVFAMLIPMVVYVGGIAFLGIYVASAVLIGYFMRRHGSYGWLPSVAVSVGVPLAVWAVFERWFLVPLPKGPLERLLGF